MSKRREKRLSCFAEDFADLQAGVQFLSRRLDTIADNKEIMTDERMATYMKYTDDMTTFREGRQSAY